MISKGVKNFLFAACTVILFFAGIEGLCRLIDGPQRFEYPTIFTYDRDKVFGLKPNIKAGEFAGKVCHTNSLGYRDAEIPAGKKPNAVRIVAVGDSVTFGHGVTHDQAYPNQLEYALNAAYPAYHFDVINTAVPGNSPFQEFYDLKRSLIFKPDIAILQYDLNDVIEPYKVFRRYGGSGMDYHKVMDVPFWHHWLSEHSRFYLYARYAYLKFRERLRDGEDIQDTVDAHHRQLDWKTAVFPPDSQEAKAAWADCLRWLNKHADVCRQNSIDCIVMVSPSSLQMYDEAMTYTQDVVRDLAQKRGLYYVGILAALRAQVRQCLGQQYGLKPDRPYNDMAKAFREDIQNIWQEYFIDIDHYTPRGHAFVAGILKDKVVGILAEKGISF